MGAAAFTCAAHIPSPMTFREFLEVLLQASCETSRVGPSPSPPASTPSSERRLQGLRPHIPGTLVYYSLDGTAAFCFRFERQPSAGIRIYILDQPAYCGRSAESIPTHRIFEHGRTFICFDPLPQTTSDAKNIARAWAEQTLRYIRTGDRF
jgi:hypothetical protein